MTEATQNTRAHKKVFSEPVAILGIQALIAATLLILICNWHMVYEEDVMAKAAQVESLGFHQNWTHYTGMVDYYNRDLFSSYYLAATVFYKLTGLTALEALNLFSVLSGVVTLSVLPFFLRRIFQINQWLSFAVLINCPILVITFTYGNEAAFAMAMTVLSALCLTGRFRGARVFGAVFYVAAAYGRSDYLFLWPALSLLLLAKNEKGGVDLPKSLRNIAPFAIASAILGVAYIALVIRGIPQVVTMGSQTTPKLFAAFFVYSANPVNFLFAAAGLLLCIWRRRFNFLAMLVVCVHFVPYIFKFNSPKYAAPSIVVMAVFAMVAMEPLVKTWRWRWCVILALLLPWFLSITPFGIFGPAKSALWYVPTDDGPLPTGGFIGFYPRVKAGFYQDRYVQEYRQFDEAFNLIEKNPGSHVFGFFNLQTVRLWAAEHLRWEMPAGDYPFWYSGDENPEDTHPKYMMRISYLYILKQVRGMPETFNKFLGEGRVRSVAGEAGNPFPDVIEFGANVPVGSDIDLGKRIQFMNAYSKGNHTLQRKMFLGDLSGTSWIPRWKFDAASSDKPPLYQDSEWVCVGREVPDAVYYSLRFPLVYATERTRPVALK